MSSTGEQLQTKPRHRPVLATARLGAIVATTLALLVPYLALRTLRPTRRARYRLALDWGRRWQRAMVAIIGIRVAVHGAIPPGSFLITPNHLGYLDVFAVGSVFKCFFVAKAEMARWPAIGSLFRLSAGIGVQRAARRAIPIVIDQMRERFALGHSVCVFLEGTSSGGASVMPFHSSLTQAAIDAPARVLPIALRWSCADPSVNIAEHVAYWKDHVFASHVWRVLGLRGLQVEVAMADPISPAQETRATLTTRAHDTVVHALGRGEIRGQATVRRLCDRADVSMTTDEIMSLTRDSR
ncbi:MAG: lysophospholipid acyltransferase family protein [Planctomycetota bacterium]